MTDRKALIVVPTYVRTKTELEVLEKLLVSAQATAPSADVLLVDDASPKLASLVGKLGEHYGAEVLLKGENEGFSRTVNAGLKLALGRGMDAVLCNADIEFRPEQGPWLEFMQEQPRSDGEGLADVVGALLCYPSGLIQHGGIFFSFLHRTFGHIHQYAPENLPEAQVCKAVPVTGALQFIRLEALDRFGLYDEDFRLGFEDVDYCIRVMRDGGECVYQPRVRAYHYESLFRGEGKNEKIARWEAESWAHFRTKWAKENFARYVPSIF